MAKKKRNLSAIQAWMDSKPGQIFLNYAYSWGASIVILGALFKLTHIAGANLMLFIGMGTEVIVFFLSGFERPWNDDGKDEESADVVDPMAVDGTEDDAPAPVTSGGTVVIGGGTVVAGTHLYAAPVAAVQQTAAAGQPQGTQSTADTATPPDAQVMADNFTALAGTAQAADVTSEMGEATQAYVEQLKELTETLKKVAEQSARLTRDSEEMETMNRTLTGINRFYEMQLRSVGQQSATIDDVNEQSRRLAEQLQELNSVYSRMIEALKMKIG